MSRLIVPPYFMRIAWAQENLELIRAEVTNWCAGKPFVVNHFVEDEHHMYGVNFPASVPSIIVREVSYFCHNLRSAMDYMVSTLAPTGPSGLSRSTHFPMFWKGVWDETPEGKPKGKTRSRIQWERYTEGMPHEAIAILKGLQPDKAERNTAGKIYRLYALYELWNEDKHRTLPTIEPGIFDCQVLWNAPGADRLASRYVPAEKFVKNNAAFELPEMVENVEIVGSVDVAIKFGDPMGYVPLVKYFDSVLNSVRERVIAPLHKIAVGIA